MFKNNNSTGLIECNAPVVGITVREAIHNHCVYEVWKDQTLVYIGCCHLYAVFKMPDLKINQRFTDTIGLDDKISIVVKHVGDRIQCYNRRGQMLRQIMPDCNKYISMQSKIVIKCNEDGLTYKTQKQACDVYGIAQSNMSAHLAGRDGYITLHGRTFSKAMEND